MEQEHEQETSGAGHESAVAARPWWILGLLAAIAVGGIALVFLGGDDSEGSNGQGATAETLELGDTDAESVAELAGLELPAGAGDFLAARLDDDSQLDVTFTIDPTEEQDFLDASGLPTPTAGNRVILHSSPLWELNEDAEISGAVDTQGAGPTGVRRSLELLDEDSVVRVRLVITPG